MKREIKFRAWDKIKKRMIYDCGKYNFFMFGENYKEDIEFLQFTGLKDKNGKEIFEGDIVSSGRFVGEVKYDIKQARFVCKKIKSEVENHPELLLWIIEWGSEVIGNKFENPELLKENVSI